MAPPTPDRAVRWAERVLGEPVVEVAPGGGGITGTKWLLLTAGGERVVLRWSDPSDWGEVGREHARREALACRALAGSGVPSPELIAEDLDGADGPALLLSWRPGILRYDALGRGALRSLAEVAVALHRVSVDDARPPLVTLRGPADPQVPSWAADRGVWREAIAVRAGGPPASPYGLIHRDLHLGNITWQGDRVTGLIDWAETSWGPPELDVAHVCSDLAMVHRGEGIEEFRAAYVRAGGVLDPDALSYWQIADALGFLPEPEHILPGITRYRPELTAGLVRCGLEDLLRHSLRAS